MLSFGFQACVRLHQTTLTMIIFLQQHAVVFNSPVLRGLTTGLAKCPAQGIEHDEVIVCVINLKRLAEHDQDKKHFNQTRSTDVSMFQIH